MFTLLPSSGWWCGKLQGTASCHHLSAITMDENIANFTGITSASTRQAEQYLRLTDNNLEQAIQLFFEDPGLAPPSPQFQPTSSSAPIPQPQPRTRNYTDEQGVVHIASDDEEDEDLEMGEADDAPAQGPSRIAPHLEDDETMARRLQEEMYQSGGPDPAGVRAPMGRTTETLVGGDDDDMQAMMQEHFMRRQQPRTQGRTGISKYQMLIRH